MLAPTSSPTERRTASRRSTEPGPSFPAETDPKTPAAFAPRNAIAFGSVHGLRDAPPIEKLMTCTMSSVAWSIAPTVADTWQPPTAGRPVQALYAMMFACGATPEIGFV